MISLFDLHCDTLLEAYNQGLNIYNCNLQISLKKASNFSPYTQVASIWSDYRLSNDEAYKKTLLVIEHYKNLGINFDGKPFILGVEDARLLNGDILRLDSLYNVGLRVLTLNWKGSTVISGGFDTDIGLTEFGKIVVKRCTELGIIVDVSHASIRTFFDVLEIATKYNCVPIASHSNSISVCKHSRNLSDVQFSALCELGSLIGVSLVPEHLGENPTIYTVLEHVLHFLSLGGKNSIALGCDFDGTSALPSEINSICDLSKLYSLFSMELGEKIANAIFYENAKAFFTKNL